MPVDNTEHVKQNLHTGPRMFGRPLPVFGIMHIHKTGHYNSILAYGMASSFITIIIIINNGNNGNNNDYNDSNNNYKLSASSFTYSMALIAVNVLNDMNHIVCESHFWT